MEQKLGAPWLEVLFSKGHLEPKVTGVFLPKIFRKVKNI
jgi:hypothetical protein